MKRFSHRARQAARLAATAVAEATWPTRCAVCDLPGAVLCAACESRLSYVDWWRACPVCGAPYGRVQCSECNPVVLGHLGREAFPFAGCASAVMFDDDSGRIVRTFKDGGERRLAWPMARIMARSLPPSWEFDAVTYVPASERARRERGFDHGADLGRAVAVQTGCPLRPMLAPPRTKDQRGLSRAERLGNLKGRFSALPRARTGGRVLLVDDVFTTGATLCDATDALVACGCTVYGLTFARA